MQITLRREAKIGIFIFSIILFTIWGFNYLKGKNLLTPSNVYYAKYKKVDGLTSSNPVTLHGFKIGVVENISLDENNPNAVVVTMVLKKGISVPYGSMAVLYSMDMLGTKAIKIQLSDQVTKHRDRDTLVSFLEEDFISSLTRQMGPARDRLETIVFRMDSVLTHINAGFDAKSAAAFRQTVLNIESITGSLSEYLMENRQSLNESTNNIRLLSARLLETQKKIDDLISGATTFTDSLNQRNFAATLDSTVRSLAQITNAINNGEGTLGQLTKNDALYRNLNDATQSLDALILDLQNNPGRYLNVSAFDFGKKVYIDQEGVEKQLTKKDYHFYVVLGSYPEPVDAMKLFGETTVLFKQDKKYYYALGPYKEYTVATKISAVKHQTYNACEVMAERKGKLISLAKAFK